MLYNYDNPNWMEEAYKNGDLPARFYYAMNGKSPTENLFLQHKEMIERYEAQRKKELEEAELQKQVETAVEEALKKIFDGFGGNISIKL